MKSKRLVSCLFIILTMVCLSGCGTLVSSEQEAKKTNHSYGEQVLTILTSEEWVTDAEIIKSKKFTEQSGITVEYEVIPANQYQEELLKRLKNNRCSDIFLVQSGFAIKTTYKVQDRCVDLSEESWVDIYDELSKEQTSVDGINYGMTYYDTTTDYYMVYNKRLFEAAGIKSVPTTFAEFEVACDALLKSGVVPIYEPLADGWHQTMLWAENGQVFEKLEPGIIQKLNNNETTFAENENMLLALTQINELAQKGYFGKTYIADEFSLACDNLASGSYAMCMLKPGEVEAIVSSDMNNDGYSKEDFGLLLLPICDNQILNVHPTGPSRFIYKGSVMTDAAKAYLEFLTDVESIQYVIDKTENIENLPFLAGQEADYATVTKEFLQGFDEEHSGAVLQDVVTYYNEQWTDIATNMTLMFIGELEPIDVLKAVDENRTKLALEANDLAWK